MFATERALFMYKNQKDGRKKKGKISIPSLSFLSPVINIFNGLPSIAKPIIIFGTIVLLGRFFAQLQNHESPIIEESTLSAPIEQIQKVETPPNTKSISKATEDTTSPIKPNLETYVERKKDDKILTGLSIKVNKKASQSNLMKKSTSPSPIPSIKEVLEQSDSKEESKVEKKRDPEKSFIDTERRKLLTLINPSKVSIDILGDKVSFLIEGVPYTKGTMIGNGFTLSNIYTSLVTNDLKDLEIIGVISKNGKEIIEFGRKIGPLFEIIYYEGGIEIKNKKKDISTGIVLEGEKLTSAFTLTETTFSKDKTTFIFELLGGKQVKIYVDNKKIL